MNPRTPLTVSALLVAALAPDRALAQCSLEIRADEPRTRSRFGTAVSLSADRALIGAPYPSPAGPQGGSAYVLDFVEWGWEETAILVAPDAEFDDRFGDTVALDGDRALVTAPGDDGDGSRSGAAYLFERAGGTWSFAQKLTAGDAEAKDELGLSGGLSGSALVVGAPGDDDGGVDAGAAYVFELSAGHWDETIKLVALDPTAGASFGSDAAIDGDRALIGAPGDAAGTGAAYVFKMAGGSWVQEAKLLPGDAAAGARIGSAVALSGDRALVSRLDESGSAYVFERSGSSWTETARLRATDGGSGLGVAVALHQDTAVVGAYRSSPPFLPAAYVFDANGGSWMQGAKFTRGSGDHYGEAVSVFGNRILVGEWERYFIDGYPDPDQPFGAVFLYDRDNGRTSTYCFASSTSSGRPGLISTNCLTGVASNEFTLTAHSVPNELGLFLYGRNQASIPAGNGRLCLGGPRYRLPASIASGRRLTHALDLTDPPSAAAQINAGTTWNFQDWFRDSAAGGAGFNFTNGVEVIFTP